MSWNRAPTVGPRSLRVAVSLSLFLFILLVCPAPAAQKPSNADCLACHGDASLSKEVDGKQVSLAVEEKKFAAGIHGSMFACVDCHSDIKASPHETTPQKVSCARCHEDAQKKYSTSLHATARGHGVFQAATCTSCHGSVHELLPSADEHSRTARANIPDTCGSCHGVKLLMDPTGISSQPVASYHDSVHGKAVAGGRTQAAVCTDCHESHDARGPGDPKSLVYKFNIATTCAKCHATESAVFQESVHGQALGRGNWRSPACVDCHGIHNIRSPLDPSSSVAPRNLAITTCASCHESVRVAGEYGVAARRTTTYMESYHGLASKLGSTVVANCASCHGIHNIFRSTDPRSTINKANLVKTCGACHPAANQRFVTSKVHVDVPLSADIGSTAVRWVRKFYIWLIVLTIGGMVLHNLLVWRKKAVEARNRQDRSIVRMSPRQRWQHYFLVASFLTLVVSGFALAYPDSWLGLVVGESFRRIAHRVAAVVLIAVGIYHLYYGAFTREGRQSVHAMLPGLKDGLDVRDNLSYYLGLGRKPAAFGKFGYAEKAEYWALVWGWLVMGATGLMLWFETQVGLVLPRWSLDVATAVHFYEAVLASLAIVVWHFYGVIFDPDVYPINWAFWDGKMSRELYHHEHPLDALEIESREAEERQARQAVSAANGERPAPPAEQEKKTVTRG